jgi:hypothetical protein
MIDINYSLRIAYFNALTGIAGVPVFYQSVPKNVSPDNYIVYRGIINTDASTMNSSDTETSIIVEIHTFSDGLNSGLNADMVAREVFNRVLPNPSGVLTADGCQIVSTRLLNDRTQDYSTEADRGYISRVLTFGHKIFMRSDIS